MKKWKIYLQKSYSLIANVYIDVHEDIAKPKTWHNLKFHAVKIY